MNEKVNEPVLSAKHVEALLMALSTWGNTTTIITHKGCVFEFKGAFPKGTVAEGYYNLVGPVPGFHGHIKLDAIQGVRFQDKLHRGRQSYAFDFQDKEGRCIFKIFLGRDEEGELIPEQIDTFKRIQTTLTL